MPRTYHTLISADFNVDSSNRFHFKTRTDYIALAKHLTVKRIRNAIIIKTNDYELYFFFWGGGRPTELKERTLRCCHYFGPPFNCSVYLHLYLYVR